MGRMSLLRKFLKVYQLLIFQELKPLLHDRLHTVLLGMSLADTPLVTKRRCAILRYIST